MESFYSLVFSIGLSNLLQDNFFDIVGNVPEEICIIILRMLDPRSLLSAAMVNKKWRKMCQADPTLRSRIRQQIVLERAERLNPITVVIQRHNQNTSQPFAALNGFRRMTVTPVSSIVRSAPTQFQPPVTRRFALAAQSQGTVQKRKVLKSKSSGKTCKSSLAKLMRL